MVQSEINLFASIGPDISGGRGYVNLGETKGKVLGEISKQRNDGGLDRLSRFFSAPSVPRRWISGSFL
jgi:hypothetical protein